MFKLTEMLFFRVTNLSSEFARKDFMFAQYLKP